MNGEECGGSGSAECRVQSAELRILCRGDSRIARKRTHIAHKGGRTQFAPTINFIVSRRGDLWSPENERISALFISTGRGAPWCSRNRTHTAHKGGRTQFAPTINFIVSRRGDLWSPENERISVRFISTGRGAPWCSRNRTHTTKQTISKAFLAQDDLYWKGLFGL